MSVYLRTQLDITDLGPCPIWEYLLHNRD